MDKKRIQEAKNNVKNSKAETSFKRAKKFGTEIKKLIGEL